MDSVALEKIDEFDRLMKELEELAAQSKEKRARLFVLLEELDAFLPSCGD